jgi:hypothetical protein
MANPIIKDPVNTKDYERFHYATACEDCTHFDFETVTCTISYPVGHFLKAQQLKDLHERGEMAFCRAIEID